MHPAQVDFAVALDREFPAAGNLCWSPYSTASALGLAAHGARGATREELARALAGGDLPGLTRVLAESATLPEAEVAVANTLWLDQRFPVRPGYARPVRELPGAAVRSADFRHDPEGARGTINAEVARTTRGLIRELVAAGMISPQTAAVIVNALYLRVAWRHAFAPTATTLADFHASTGARRVPTMRQQERLRYAETPHWRMVTLPTRSPAVVVDLVLPDPAPGGRSAGRGRPALAADSLTTLWRAGHSRRVDLALPRFRVESRLVLNQPLARLGVTAAFDPDRADFGGIIEAEPVVVDRVVHQAVLRVDEQGFEGAAATATMLRTVGMDLSPPVPFHLDRPFLVLVRHAGTNAIFFLAWIVEP